MKRILFLLSLLIFAGAAAGQDGMSGPNEGVARSAKLLSVGNDCASLLSMFGLKGETG
jgi:hypothetical protein